MYRTLLPGRLKHWLRRVGRSTPIAVPDAGEPSEDSQHSVAEQVAPEVEPAASSKTDMRQSRRLWSAIPLVEGEALRIAFIAQHPSSWLNFHSIWQFASQDDRFKTRVILCPFRQPAVSTESCLNDMRNLLLDNEVPFVYADRAGLDVFRPHVVFVQNPYEETRPANLRLEALSDLCARVAYVPYGLEIGGGAWNIKAQFDTELHRKAWRIFVRSQRSKKMFGKYCLSGNDHVHVSGHPKFDHQTVHHPLSHEIARKADVRKVLLWTPHFSVGDPPTWSTFSLYSERILRKSSSDRACAS